MEKRTLILLITILILGFIISCDGVFLPRNDVQPFEYVYDLNEDLDRYLNNLNDNYKYFPQTGETYNENEFRRATHAYFYFFARLEFFESISQFINRADTVKSTYFRIY